MRIVGIDDLVLDYYYDNGKLIAVDGGISVYNILVNLAAKNLPTSAIGSCGNDIKGKISIDSLKRLNVDTSNIEENPNINTRSMHINFVNGSFTSKRRCPICGEKDWYEKSLIEVDNILDKLDKDDILLFQGATPINKKILDNCNNKALVDLGYYNEFNDYSDEYIIDYFKRKFEILNINERVYNYFKERFNNKNIYNGNLIVITKGKEGATFIYKDNVINNNLKPTKEIDPNGAGDAFFSSIIYDYLTNKDFNIDEAFENATKLTSKVVSVLGARGHLHPLYEVEKENDKCTCKTLKLKK